MRFTSILFAAFAAIASAAENPFTLPTGFTVTAGEPVKVTWTATTPGTITLKLRSGAAGNLDKGTVIESGLENDGEYIWTPDPATARGSDYVLEIISDSDPSETNYSSFFILESTTIASSLYTSSLYPSTTKIATPSGYETTSKLTPPGYPTSTTSKYYPTTTKVPYPTTYYPPHGSNSTFTTKKSTSSSSSSSKKPVTLTTSTKYGGASTTTNVYTPPTGPTGTGAPGASPTGAAPVNQRNGAGLLALAIAGAVIAL